MKTRSLRVQILKMNKEHITNHNDTQNELIKIQVGLDRTSHKIRLYSADKKHS